ncbi:MAG: hypothetical protein KQJ78_07670 [Deltaproteobacteria bacterium]|nr:hypothetical protein [Deltaproteobacteria bacterium]
MPKTLISDVIVPEVFAPYVINRTAELSALYASGVIATVPNLNLLGMLGGQTVNLPFWSDLDGDDEVLSDSTSLSPSKIAAKQDVAVLNARGKAWAVNDLAKKLSGDDPLRAIGDLTAAWWARKMQATLIKVLTGAFAGSGMTNKVHDISSLTASLRVIDASTTLDALQLMGDAKDLLTAIGMHSATETKLKKNDLIDYVMESEQNTRVPYFLGKRVVVDDNCPVAAGVYTTYLFGAGAIGYGEGSPPVPAETDRDSLAGDDMLVSRRHFILHPRGVKWIGTAAGATPTNTELGTGTNWERVYDDKQIRVVVFKHKLA